MVLFTPKDALHWHDDVGIGKNRPLTALQQTEIEAPVVDVWRQVGINEETFYVWNRSYAGMRG